MAETLSFASSSISDSMRVTVSRNCACGAHHKGGQQMYGGKEASKSAGDQQREKTAHFPPEAWLDNAETSQTHENETKPSFRFDCTIQPCAVVVTRFHTRVTSSPHHPLKMLVAARLRKE